MKKLVSILVVSLFAFDAGFAAPAGRSTMAGKMMAAPRYTASVNQLKGTASANSGETLSVVQTTQEQVQQVEEVKKDMRETERNACINNNIGIGNTFVWASRYSDTSNYANMVEDVENPENNVCFVKVELKSKDESRISVADVAPKYFVWGEAITCGSWADKNEMEKRILEARKGARIGGIIASTVGGAGIGVGAMELFGNKLINGAVEGQKAKDIQASDLHRAYLLGLKKDNYAQYSKICEHLKTIAAAKGNGITESEYTKYEVLVKECQ